MRVVFLCAPAVFFPKCMASSWRLLGIFPPIGYDLCIEEKMPSRRSGESRLLLVPVRAFYPNTIPPSRFLRPQSLLLKASRTCPRNWPEPPLRPWGYAVSWAPCDKVRTETWAYSLQIYILSKIRSLVKFGALELTYMVSALSTKIVFWRVKLLAGK